MTEERLYISVRKDCLQIQRAKELNIYLIIFSVSEMSHDKPIWVWDPTDTHPKQTLLLTYILAGSHQSDTRIRQVGVMSIFSRISYIL